MSDFVKAVAVTEKLRDQFKLVADSLGAEKAFYLFAGEAVQAGLDEETERKFVELFRLVYDEYVGAA